MPETTSGDGRNRGSRFTRGLVEEVFAVLDAHGYVRGDDAAVGLSVVALRVLCGGYEDTGATLTPPD